MARLKGPLKILGSVGDFTAYERFDSDVTFFRTKGGATKKKIKTHVNFSSTRANNKDFGACSELGKILRAAFFPVKHLGDNNYSGKIISILKKVQEFDVINQVGDRDIYCSKYISFFEGFSLNKRILFDSVFRRALSYSFDVVKGSVSIDFPELYPDVHLVNIKKSSFFRLTISLGVVPDYLWDEKKVFCNPTIEGCEMMHATYSSDWQSTNKLFSGRTIDLAIANFKPDSSLSLILSIGIEFGNSLTDKIIEPVKRSGSAKILATANFYSMNQN